MTARNILAAAARYVPPFVANLFAVGTGASVNVVLYQNDGVSPYKRVQAPGPVGPTGTLNGSAYSATGTFWAAATGNTPFVAMYTVSGNSYTKLTNPTTLPGSAAQDVAVNSDGTLLVYCTLNSPFLRCYKRTGTAFTNVSNPANLPTATANFASISSDGKWLSVGYAASPYLITYAITGSYVLTKITDADVAPTGIVNGLTYNETSDRLYVAHTTTPFLTSYSVDTTTGVLTKLANPADLPRGNGLAVAVSPDGVYIAVANSSATATSRLSIYKNTSDVLTLLSDVDIGPTGNPTSLAFNATGDFLACGHATTPFVSFYQRSGDVFTKTNNPTSLPTATATSVSSNPPPI